MRDKIESIQVLRALAAMLVVVTHIYVFESKATPGPQRLPLFSVFGRSGVDLFFVISGFVMVHTTRDAIASWRTALVFLTRRATRIYPLYWLFTAILIAGYFFFPQLRCRTGYEELSTLKSLLLVPQAERPILVVGWTLIHEMYFYLCFAMMLIFPRRTRGVLLGLWLVALLAMNGLRPFVPGVLSDPIPSLVFHPLTAEFILGCFVALMLGREAKFSSHTTLAAGVVLLFACWLPYHVVTGGEEPSTWVRPIIFGVPYALIVYGFVLKERSSTLVYPKVFVRLGDASYSLYLSNFLIISALSRVFALRTRDAAASSWGAIDNVLFVAASLFLSVVFALVSYRYLEKPLQLRARGIISRF